jgi:hypothetical protein
MRRPADVVVWAWPGRKSPRPTFSIPSVVNDRSDGLGGVARLEPMNGRMVDVVGERDLAQRLALCHALQHFARLMLGQLGFATEPHAIGEGADAPLVGSLKDQIAFELSSM